MLDGINYLYYIIIITIFVIVKIIDNFLTSRKSSFVIAKKSDKYIFSQRFKSF